MNARLIAIDGAAGTGKSTVARRLARALALPVIDTGLMYRALARVAIDTGADRDDGPGLARLVDDLRFSVGGNPPQLEVEGCATDELRTLEVDSIVSAVSRHPEVRTRMRSIQRDLGRHGAVMEGRDIGSVVFPDAVVKLFLVADAEVRMDRRIDERAEPPDATSAALLRRDERDARTNPMEPAPGAWVIDTSTEDVDTVVERALDIVRRHAPGLRDRIR